MDNAHPRDLGAEAGLTDLTRDGAVIQPSIALDDLERGINAALESTKWQGPESLRTPTRLWLRTDKILISRIRELESALADALYWLKPGMDKRAAEMGKGRDDLTATLHKDFALPAVIVEAPFDDSGPGCTRKDGNR